MHRRFKVSLIMGILAAVPVLSCSDDATPSTSAVSLKVGVSTENAVGMLAEQSGVFTDAPYSIEWVELSGSNETIEAVNAGAIDVVVSVGLPAVVLAQANSTERWTADDAPFRVVAAWELRASAGFVVVVPADSPVRSVADLRGSRVAFAKGSWGQYFWVKASAAAGLTEGDVEEVTLPASEGRAAFRSGEVDALIAGHRSALAIVDDGSARIIAGSDEYSIYTTVSLVRRGLLDEPAREAAVADFLRRLASEDQWIDDNRALVASEFIAAFELSPAAAEVAARSEVRTRVPLDAPTVALLQEVADTFLALGAAAQPTDVRIIIDDRFDDGLLRST